jgi:predicted phage terminase large subunit-like protein
MQGVELTAETIEGLSGIYLSPRYDQPQITPEFHRECWDRYCSDAPMACTAAPRNHAKSTALTHDYILANVLFRIERYVILIGSSEESAIEHLGDIANELRENEPLIRDFKIKGFVQDQKTDIVVECVDGYTFRILARGAEQKIRGRKWMGGRPGLIVFDDIEDDEQVENKERREKFSRWFYRAVLQALRDGGKVRGHGTILHEDSLLNNICHDKSWAARIYRAHRSFSEFSDILWPEKFPEARLRGIRQVFINRRDSAGYAQEYLNDPRDHDAAYLRREWFLPMTEEDHESFKRIAVGVDLAISKADHANRTSFTVGGKDLSNILHVVDQRTGRWDAVEIIDEWFAVQQRWKPEVFYVEKGPLWSAFEPILRQEMRQRDLWLNIDARPATKDKAGRGKTFQARIKAGGMKFDFEASWFEDYLDECLKFTAHAEATLDDQFDSTAWLCIGMEDLEVEEDDQMTQEEIENEFQSRALMKTGGGGRSNVTGY